MLRRDAWHRPNKTIYHEPGYAVAYFDFGVALAGAERYDQARAQFDASVRLDPKLAEAHVSLADMLALRGMTSRAISHYQQAQALNTEMGATHLGLGSCLVSQEKRTEVIPRLEMATRSNEPGSNRPPKRRWGL